jgi:hypothetical protein
MFLLPVTELRRSINMATEQRVDVSEINLSPFSMYLCTCLLTHVFVCLTK